MMHIRFAEEGSRRKKAEVNQQAGPQRRAKGQRVTGSLGQKKWTLNT